MGALHCVDDVLCNGHHAFFYPRAVFTWSLDQLMVPLTPMNGLGPVVHAACTLLLPCSYCNVLFIISHESISEGHREERITQFSNLESDIESEVQVSNQAGSINFEF